MELLKVIQSRRSIRKFKSNEVPDAVIRELLDAARLAPSGSNLQATRFVVIKSPAERMKLKECTPLPFVAHAPVIIACCIDREAMGNTLVRYRELMEAQAFVGTPLDDPALMEAAAKRRSSMDQATIKAYLTLNAAIAIEHIVLRAVDLGLGSCWIMMFDSAKTKSMLELDDRYDVVALLPVGYPDQSPAARPRLPLEDLILKEV
ncbi:MAG: nitroreductase family protein [Syntrophaceae bacterium]